IAGEPKAPAGEPAGWTPLSTWPPLASGQILEPALMARASMAATDALAAEQSFARAPGSNPQAGALAALRLATGPGSPPAVAVLVLPDAPLERLQAATLMLHPAADIPAAYLEARALAGS